MTGLRRIRFCREGIVYCIVLVAVVGGAWSRQLNLLMLVGCMLAGPLLFSLVYGRLALRRLTLGRELPGSLRVDQPLVVEISVTNHRRHLGIWGIEVQDCLQREGAGSDPPARVSVFFPRIAAGETRKLEYRGRLGRRGRYRFGPLRVSTRFPLGLVRHLLLVDQSDVLVVHPKLGQLTHEWAQGLRENTAGSQRIQRRGAVEADYYGLRDWRPGDDRRWIHWRTSARRGALVVRQFEMRRSEDLALLVDLWQPLQPTERDRELVETAVSFAGTVIADACRRTGRNLTVHVAARDSLVCSGAATAFLLSEQMDALSEIAPHHEAELPRALCRALALVPAKTPTVFISTRPIDRAALERDGRLAGRACRLINVADDELARYFQA